MNEFSKYISNAARKLDGRFSPHLITSKHKREGKGMA